MRITPASVRCGWVKSSTDDSVAPREEPLAGGLVAGCDPTTVGDWGGFSDLELSAIMHRGLKQTGARADRETMRRSKRQGTSAFKEREAVKVPETITIDDTVFARLPTLEQWLMLQRYEEPGVPEYDMGA